MNPLLPETKSHVNDTSLKADQRTESILRNALDGTPINLRDAEDLLLLCMSQT
jgi:hypothetical protein